MEQKREKMIASFNPRESYILLTNMKTDDVTSAVLKFTLKAIDRDLHFYDRF